MARKRFIKPEFFHDTDLADLSIEARYLFASMWPWMDRQGVIEADARIHRANAFPHDEKITTAKVSTWLDELVRHGFVIRFTWQGKLLLYCPTFTRHQKLYPDEKAKFNVHDDLLVSLANDAPPPLGTMHEHGMSRHSTVSEPEKEKEEVKVKSIKKEEAQKFDFEALYEKWLRKRGKAEGMQRLLTRIKTPAEYDKFAKAVEHFNQEARILKTEMKFIPYWSSFVGSGENEPWMDYVDPPKTHQDSISGESREERHARLIQEHEELQERNRRVYGEGA